MFEECFGALEPVRGFRERQIWRGFVGDLHFEQLVAGSIPLQVLPHYHTTRAETYLVESGVVRVHLCPLNKQGEKAGSMVSRMLLLGAHVTVPLMCAHMLELEPQAAVLCFSPTDAPDQHPVAWFGQVLRAHQHD